MSRTLAQKNTRYLLTWLPVVLLLSSALFFVILDGHSSHMQDKQLLLKQQNIWRSFQAHPTILPDQIEGEYTIVKDGSAKNVVPGYTSLTREYNWQGNRYQLTTYVTTKEYSHLVIKVFATEIFVFFLLLIAIVFLNKKASRKIWKPFYETLASASAYDVANMPSVQVTERTGVIEFDELNNELKSLIAKVNLAYSNQKQFVENASHEIQTPLAIIRSKLDLLINEKGLTESTASLLCDIAEANDRLSQMNKSLLMLARIDNNQYPAKADINISLLVKKLLANYQEHYDQFPKLTVLIKDDVFITGNSALMEVLFGNLIKNAVIHNLPAGFIHLKLDADQFSIENSGPVLDMDPSLLFERFNKANSDSKTTGLGLALVRQICLLYNMNLQYKYADRLHTVTVDFKPSRSS